MVWQEGGMETLRVTEIYTVYADIITNNHVYYTWSSSQMSVFELKNMTFLWQMGKALSRNI